MSARRAAPAWRWMERALLVVGVGCLGYYAYMNVEARQFQREQTQRLLESIASPTPQPAAKAEASRASGADAARAGSEAASDGALPPVAPRASKFDAPPGALALLEIPRLAMSSTVMSGDGEKTLSVAVGHLPDTPLPWEPGNSAMAAHRDGLFRPLKNIRIGDDIRVRTAHGEFAYRVHKTKIVLPTDLSVLAPTATDTLTLITCYPFNYVGHAPKRFIVQAERVKDARPDR